MFCTVIGRVVGGGTSQLLCDEGDPGRRSEGLA